MKAAVQANLIPRDPTEGFPSPKGHSQPKRILDDGQLEWFMEEIRKDALWYDLFYTELTTGLRRGELCGLKWEDFHEESGTLMIRRTFHKEKGGKLTAWDTKTAAGARKTVLPPSTAKLLKKRKEAMVSEWIFPNPIKPEMPIDPSSTYRHLKTLLRQAGLPDIRFHDLRHTFATNTLAGGMDVKTLSTIIGHVSSSTTLNVYAHATDAMKQEAAANFRPTKGIKRKWGTGSVIQCSKNRWHGYFSRKWPDGTTRHKDVYAPTKEECEALLKEAMAEMKAAISTERKRIKNKAKAS